MQTLSFSEYFPLIGLCVNFLLLAKAALMMAEKGTEGEKENYKLQKWLVTLTNEQTMRV